MSAPESVENKQAVEACDLIAPTWRFVTSPLYRNVEKTLELAPRTMAAILACCAASDDDRIVWRGVLSTNYFPGKQSIMSVQYAPAYCTEEEIVGGKPISTFNDFLTLLPITRRVYERAYGKVERLNSFIELDMTVVSMMIVNSGSPRTKENLHAAMLHKFISMTSWYNKDIIECIAKRVDLVELHVPELKKLWKPTAAQIDATIDDQVHSALIDGVL